MVFGKAINPLPSSVDIEIMDIFGKCVNPAEVQCESVLHNRVRSHPKSNNNGIVNVSLDPPIGNLDGYRWDFKDEKYKVPKKGEKVMVEVQFQHPDFHTQNAIFLE